MIAAEIDMDAATAFVGDHLILGVLVLTRLGMVMMAMPGIGGGVPRRVRALLAITATVVLLPTIAGMPMANQLPPVDSLPQLAIAIGREAAVGMLVGGTVQILMAGLQMGGEVISGTGGMQLGDAIDPTTQASVPAIARLVGMLVTVVMFGVGGHRWVLELLMDSFRLLPPTEIRFDQSTIDLVIEQIAAAVVAGMRLAAPIIAALLLANLITGLISRTLPQINVLAIGLSINALTMLIVLSLTLGSAGMLFSQELTAAIASMRQSF